jgi:signal transduction histidine kinase
MFLEELEHTLASELRHDDPDLVAKGAGLHGGELLRRGFTVAQVVHDYGDACQAITELAIELQAPISTEEFRALNKCLDNAIADAVTEYERQREIDVVAEDARKSNEHLGFLAHELRNLLGSALLAFEVVRAGSVGINGSTGDLLGRSLVGLRDLVNRSITEVRLGAGIAKPERVVVARFVEEVEVEAILSANARGVKLTVISVGVDELAVNADRQILSAVISNLLQNAFKYTRPRSEVTLRTRATADRVVFEIEDECGGIQPEKAAHLFDSYEQQSADRSGLGLGLAICVRGVKALGGTLNVGNHDHGGCKFTVELPRLQTDQRARSAG